LPKSAAERAGNLPCDVTTFVGRAEEVRQLQRALAASRLVTLVGPGGVGKSRLALAFARKHQRAFRHGVWFVGLDAVSDPALVGHAVASALQLTVPSTHDPDEVVRSHLSDRCTLLLIDNCEHLVASVGRLISALLRVAPDLQILATSRIPLGITGEAVWPVPPLGVAAGDDDTRAPTGDRAATEALTLLADRAASVAPGLRLDDHNMPAAEALCRKLEGLPLAIELAATRLRVMSIEQLLHALDRRYDVLSVGMADAPERHQSLRAAVEWSYELCSAQERDLWATLSILSGSFELEVAVSLCGDVPIDQILRALEALTNMSLLITEHTGGSVRFRMLETLREFGRDRAVEAGRTELLRERLCAHYLLAALKAADQNLGSGQAAWISRMRDERPNLWAALDIALKEPPESTTALRICGALWFLWVSGATGEGHYWLDRALARNREPSVERARALWTAGYVSLTAGDLAQARDLLTKCSTLARGFGDETLVAQAAQLLGVTHMFGNDLPAAIELLQGSVGFFSRTEARHPASILAVGQLGVAHVLNGEVEHGTALTAECVTATEETGELWCKSWARWLQAVSMWFAGDLGATADSARASLHAKAELDDRVGIAACIELMAWVAHAEGALERSARLTGASRRLWRQTRGNRLFGFAALLQCTDECETAARSTMGSAAYDSLVAEGGRLDDPEAVYFALGVAAPQDADQRNLTNGLTRRELEVASLIAQGMSNREIAAQLVVSSRTAESHVEHIRSKLGFKSRSQIAAWVLSREN